jgi:hypothetical protein
MPLAAVVIARLGVRFSQLEIIKWIVTVPATMPLAPKNRIAVEKVERKHRRI